MKTRILLVAMVVFISLSTYAQMVYQFPDVKKNGDLYVYRFELLGITNSSQAQSIITELKGAHLEVKDCKVLENKICIISSERPLKPDDIKETLKALSVYFDYQKLTQVKKRTDGMPDSFPVYVSTGDQVKDDKTYDEAKAKWISENKAIYEQMNKREQIVNQK